jgi:hypothetical protein
MGHLKGGVRHHEIPQIQDNTETVNSMFCIKANHYWATAPPNIVVEEHFRKSNHQGTIGLKANHPQTEGRGRRHVKLLPWSGH